ncbi:MAG: hypothetical protein ACSI46_21650 [Gloeotrichia echinulata DVL01]
MRFIINQCLNDRVGNIVIGWNIGQKQNSSMGKRNNQNFVVIPTSRLIDRLKQLCPEYGITLTITEEAYSSLASFLDCDSLPKYGEKPEGWNLVEPVQLGDSTKVMMAPLLMPIAMEVLTS